MHSKPGSVGQSEQRSSTMMNAWVGSC
jgi:hypothetical protein